MIKYLQNVRDQIVTKLNQLKFNPILAENAYHNPEESERDANDLSSDNYIVIRDLKWRSNSISLIINFFFTNCMH